METTEVTQMEETYMNYLENNENKKENITLDSFHLLSIIGRGSYAKVALIRKKDTGKIYALKILKKAYIKKRN